MTRFLHEGRRSVMVLCQDVTILVMFFLVGCAKPAAPPAPTVNQALFAESTSAPSTTPTIEPGVTPKATATRLVTSTAPSIRLCSPFPGYGREQLVNAISNPYRPPARPGSDDPHQAVDLAITQDGMAVGGEAVNLMLSGKVAAVVEELFPYGNAIMIETPLENLTDDFLSALLPPTPRLPWDRTLH